MNTERCNIELLGSLEEAEAEYNAHLLLFLYFPSSAAFKKTEMEDAVWKMGGRRFLSLFLNNRGFSKTA